MKTQIASVKPAHEMEKSNVWNAVKLIHAQNQKTRKQWDGDILELGGNKVELRFLQ
jgi:hypothetical protein